MSSVFVLALYRCPPSLYWHCTDARRLCIGTVQMSAVFVLALLVAAASGRDLRLDNQWQSFKSTYGKLYSLGDEAQRWVTNG